MKRDKIPNTTKEPEITPEMILAGVCEFVAYDPRFEEPEAVVGEIYRAMVRAKRR